MGKLKVLHSPELPSLERCKGCGWSESEDYDISSGPKMDKNGWAVDQYGGLTPPPKGTKL